MRQNGEIMIYWHEQAYLGEGISEIYADIKKAADESRISGGLYFITLSQSKYEQLDIYSSYMFNVRLRHNDAPVVVGVAAGKDEAAELVSAMALDIYSKTGKIDFKEYFKV